MMITTEPVDPAPVWLQPGKQWKIRIDNQLAAWIDYVDGTYFVNYSARFDDMDPIGFSSNTSVDAIKELVAVRYIKRERLKAVTRLDAAIEHARNTYDTEVELKVRARGRDYAGELLYRGRDKIIVDSTAPSLAEAIGALVLKLEGEEP